MSVPGTVSAPKTISPSETMPVPGITCVSEPLSKSEMLSAPAMILLDLRRIEQELQQIPEHLRQALGTDPEATGVYSFEIQTLPEMVEQGRKVSQAAQLAMKEIDQKYGRLISECQKEAKRGRILEEYKHNLHNLEKRHRQMRTKTSRFDINEDREYHRHKMVLLSKTCEQLWAV